MTRLEFPTYLAAIRAESARFRDVLAACDPAARVPACPDWDAADLLWHLTEVQGFWGRVVRERPAEPERREPSRPAAYADLLSGFDRASAELAEALDDADPADRAWTWAPEQTVGFTLRRQAHEALIHRVDAEQAAGLPSELGPALAVDGVAEVLGVMYGGCPPWGTFDPLPHHVVVEVADTGARLFVQLGLFSGTDPDGDRSYADEPDISLVPDPGGEPSVVVRGTAGVLDAWLWKRGDDAEVTLVGDDSALAHLRGVLGQPIN